jgi:CheY-like chemotaxis protein
VPEIIAISRDREGSPAVVRSCRRRSRTCDPVIHRTKSKIRAVLGVNYPQQGKPVPILNVDDYAPSRFLRSRILERAGYEVREAETAEQAIAVCESPTPPNLVLLDVALPDGDGFTVCERVKAVSSKIPIVMITTVYLSSQARREGFIAGADEYLLDPVDPERLVSVVAQFLDPTRAAAATPPPTIITDAAGVIVTANAAAGRLLNLSARGMRDRSMLAFFAPGRDRMAGHMRRALQGQIVQEVATIRPRDRKPFTVRVDISTAPFERGGALEWILEASAEAAG